LAGALAAEVLEHPGRIYARRSDCNREVGTIQLKVSGEAGADTIAEGLAIDGLSFQRGFGGFDDGAHLLHGASGGFGDGSGYGGIHLGFAGAGGEIGFDNREFLGFLVDEISAVAPCELVDRLFALLDERLQQLDGLGFVQGANFFRFLVLDRGLDAAEDTQAELVLCAHGAGKIFLDFF
jgi:hypothetical protein